MTNDLTITKRFDLIIFDMNGTLTNTPFIDKAPLSILAGRDEKLAELKAAGLKLAIASNQGGVAFGFTTEAAAVDEVAGIAATLNIDGFRVAFGHPSPKRGYEEYASPEHLEKRKPGPGMPISLMKEFKVLAARTLMVGDRDEDRDAAAAAKIHFMWAKDFFGNINELLGTIWQSYRSLMEVADETDSVLDLRINYSGSGQVGYGHGTMQLAQWDMLEQAPAAIEKAIKGYQERLAEKKRVAEADFDPFLDSDDLP